MYGFYTDRTFPGNTVANIGAFFYSLQRGSNISTDHQRSISKLLPLLDVVTNVNDNNYFYNVRYGQAVFNNVDFIETSSRDVFLTYFRTMSFGMSPGPFGGEQVAIPAGSYSMNLTFLYFEKQ
jgi:hypothetical protein